MISVEWLNNRNMKVKIPKVNQTDIIRIIRRDFPHEKVETIHEILNDYNSNNESGNRRVHASILKLSNGNLNSLIEYVEKAKKDFRDVISLSENPNYWNIAFDESITEKEKNLLISKDWEQYQKWLST